MARLGHRIQEPITAKPYIFRCRHQRAARRENTFLLRMGNFSHWGALDREILAAKNDTFFKKMSSYSKKNFRKSINRRIRDLYGGNSRINVVFG